jgi:glycosyltransferase involved in cell wall biosynthesis
MALLEAALSRVPAIASDLPAVREAFGEDGVLLVPAKDVDAWRQAIERALNRYPEALVRAEAAERDVRDHYSLEEMVDKHAQLYRRFLRPV